MLCAFCQRQIQTQTWKGTTSWTRLMKARKNNSFPSRVHSHGRSLSSDHQERTLRLVEQMKPNLKVGWKRWTTTQISNAQKSGRRSTHKTMRRPVDWRQLAHSKGLPSKSKMPQNNQTSWTKCRSLRFQWIQATSCRLPSRHRMMRWQSLERRTWSLRCRLKV